MQGTLILVVGGKVHDLGTREIPDDKHFRVEGSITLTPCECDCPPAPQQDTLPGLTRGDGVAFA